MAVAGKFISQNALKISGYFDGQNARWELQRSNIVVFSGGKKSIASDLEEKGESDVELEIIKKVKRDEVRRHIRRKQNGTYEFRIRENGKNYSKSNKDIEKLIDIVLSNKYKPRKVSGVSVAEFISMYTKLYRQGQYSDKTKEEFANKVRHVVKGFGQQDITKVKTEDVQNLINSIKGDVIRKKVFYLLKSVFDKAVALGKIKKDPTIAVILPYVKIKTKRKGLLFQDQIALVRALDNYDTDFKKFVLASLVLGTRAEETCNLKLSDIDFKTRVITIHGTKTENAERSFIISQAMIDLLKQNVTEDKIFLHLKNSYYHRLKRLYAKLGIANMNVHSLRHTCSANLCLLKMPDKERQQRLGHSSIVITNNVYTWLQVGITKKDVENLYGPLY